jgi:protein TonB
MTYGRAASFIVAMGLHACALWWVKPPEPLSALADGELQGVEVEVELVEAAAEEAAVETPPEPVPPEPTPPEPPTPPEVTPPEPTPPPPEPEPLPPPPPDVMEEPTPAPPKPKPKPKPKPVPRPAVKEGPPAESALPQQRAGLGGSAARGATDDGRARRRRDVKPDYPSWMKEKGIRPAAKVAIVISAEGRVLDARIHVSSGYPEFDQNCLRAARATPFKPKTVNGVPVQSSEIQPYSTELR